MLLVRCSLRITSILALGWQIIRRVVEASIHVNYCPELNVLLQNNETVEELAHWSAEKILFRWLQYHLARAGHELEEKTFGEMKVKCSEFII
jgi:plastin-1